MTRKSGDLVPGFTIWGWDETRDEDDRSFKVGEKKGAIGFSFFGARIGGDDTITLEVDLEPGDFTISAWPAAGKGDYELTVREI